MAENNPGTPAAQLEEGLAQLKKLEAEYAAFLASRTPRARVDAEKPFFDYLRYILQTVAVGVAGLTVARFLYLRDPPAVEWAMGWTAVVLCGAVFCVMLVRVSVLGTVLVVETLPNWPGLGPVSWGRALVGTAVGVSVLTFVAELFVAAGLQGAN